jgi:hypothetical protein
MRVYFTTGNKVEQSLKLVVYFYVCITCRGSGVRINVICFVFAFVVERGSDMISFIVFVVEIQ